MERWMKSRRRPSLAMRVLAFACVGLTFSNAAMACPGAMAAMAAETAAKMMQGKAQQKRGAADQKEQQAKQAEQAAKEADEKAKQADEAVKKASDEARDLLNQSGSKPPVDQAQILQKQQELAEAQARLKELERLNSQINAPIAPPTPQANGGRGLTSTEAAVATGGSTVQNPNSPQSSANAVAQEMESVKAKIAKLQQEISALQAGGQGGSTKPVDAPALKAANEKVKQLSEAAQRAHQDADKAHQAADQANKDAENANKDAEDGGKQQSGAADAAQAAAQAAPAMDKPFCISVCPKPPLSPEPCKSSCDAKCAGMAAAVKMAAAMIKSDGQKKQGQGQQGQQTAQKGQEQEQQLAQQENKYGQEAGGVAGAGGTGIDYSNGALGGGSGSGSGLGNLDVTQFEIGGVPVGSGPNASGANIGGATNFGASDNPLSSEYGAGGADSNASGNINGSNIASDGTVGGGRSLASADGAGGAGGTNGMGGAGFNFGGLDSGAFSMAGLDGAAGAGTGSEIPGFGGDSAKSSNPALDHQSNYRSLTGLDVEEGSSRRLLTLWERAALRNQYFDIETGKPLAEGRGRTLAGKNQMISKAASRLGSDPTVIFMDKGTETPKTAQPVSVQRK